MHRWSQETIGAKCHVSRRTIERDIAAWVGTDDFYQWLHQLWLELYRRVDNDELVLKEVTKIIGKTMTQRIEAFSYEKIEETITVNVSEDEDEILSKAASILARKDRAGSLH